MPTMITATSLTKKLKKVGERIFIDLRNPPKSSRVAGRPIRFRRELRWSNF
jgi:hypothetical protein